MFLFLCVKLLCFSSFLLTKGFMLEMLITFSFAFTRPLVTVYSNLCFRQMTIATTFPTIQTQTQTHWSRTGKQLPPKREPFHNPGAQGYGKS